MCYFYLKREIEKKNTSMMSENDVVDVDAAFQIFLHENRKKNSKSIQREREGEREREEEDISRDRHKRER